MASAGSIVIDLLARTGSFETDMDRAAKSAKKRADEIDKALSAIGTAAATAGAAAAGALALLVNQTMNSAREIERQAQISNASADAFQTMAYGARTVGIEQDKLADIMKDVNDRVGDFISTGGGPMKDFFEQIAPKVGVTADQFARLSGPEALQLYVSSLEKAGVSQQEMTFYLEAMASDTTALIPLLANGGREMAALGEEARRTGQIMSDETIAAASELKGQMDQLSGQLTGAKNIIAGELIPVLGVAATEMINFGGSGDVARTAAGLLRGVLQDLVISAAEVVAWFQVSGKTLGGWAAQAGAILSWDFAGAKFIGQELDKDLAGIEARLNVFRGRVSAAGTDLAGALGAGAIMPAAPSLGSGSGARTPTGRTSAPRSSSRASGLTDEQKAHNDAMKEGARIYEQTRTASEKLSMEFAKLNDLRKAGAIDQETYNRAVFDAQENFDTLIAKTKEATDKGKESFDELRQAIDGWGKSSAEALVDFAMTGKSSFKDMVNSILADLARMMVYRNITGPLANTISGMDWGSIGSAVAGMFGGFRASGGPVAGGTSYIVGERGPELFTPHTSGAIVPNGALGGAKVSVVVNNNAGPDTRATATASTDATGNTQIMVMVEKIEGMMGRRIGQGGGLAPMLEGRYGLNPAAGARR